MRVYFLNATNCTWFIISVSSARLCAKKTRRAAAGARRASLGIDDPQLASRDQGKIMAYPLAQNFDCAQMCTVNARIDASGRLYSHLIRAADDAPANLSQGYK
jgi:hypothetical protein